MSRDDTINRGCSQAQHKHHSTVCLYAGARLSEQPLPAAGCALSSEHTSVSDKPFTCEPPAHGGILHACGQTSGVPGARNHPGGGNGSRVTLPDAALSATAQRHGRTRRLLLTLWPRLPARLFECLAGAGTAGASSVETGKARPSPRSLSRSIIRSWQKWETCTAAN